MRINGEAIYNSRPVNPFKSGKTCFTSNPDGTIYVIYLAEPSETKIPAILSVNGFQPSKGSAIELLGRKGNLAWKTVKDTGFVIEVPASVQKNPPCKHAWVFKIRMNNMDNRG